MQGSSFEQLPLGINLSDSASFDNFYTANDTEIVENLRSLIQGPSAYWLIYLWGAQGSGKTHLLHATCRLAAEQNIRTIYLPLTELQLSPAIFQDTGLAELICIDDLSRVSGDRDLESALMYLYESLMQTKCKLVLAGDAPPQHLKLAMPDLSTRIASQLVFRLPDLNDEGKRQAIQLRATGRGFEIGNEVVQYILRHFSRNNDKLFELLDQIDRTTLAEQRRVTIPLVKALIEGL